MWKEGKQWQRAIKDQFLEVKNPLLHTESPCQGLTYLCEQGTGRREKPIQREVRIRHFLAKPGAQSQELESWKETLDRKVGSATSHRQ